MSHLSDVGFKVEKPEDIEKIISNFKIQAERKDFGNYFQYKLSDESGAHFYWYGQKKTFFRQEQIVGFIPAFKGGIKQEIKGVHLLSNKEYPLEPSLDLWVYNNSDEYPLIIDIVNYLEIKDKKIEGLKEINAILFAKDFEYFNDNDDFYQKYPKKNEKAHIPAPGMFIPTGTFSPKDDPGFKPHAECWCYGKILKEEKLENKLTGEYFYHFIMKTYAAEYDVVVDVKSVNVKPNIGAIIGGVFWPCTIL